MLLSILLKTSMGTRAHFSNVQTSKTSDLQHIKNLRGSRARTRSVDGMTECRLPGKLFDISFRTHSKPRAILIHGRVRDERTRSEAAEERRKDGAREDSLHRQCTFRADGRIARTGKFADVLLSYSRLRMIESNCSWTLMTGQSQYTHPSTSQRSAHPDSSVEEADIKGCFDSSSSGNNAYRHHNRTAMDTLKTESPGGTTYISN
ncbi:hypothetical protein EDB19DRAFT_2029124 [Suillus lakei]|nr:hypothetical protein EDB19DRAFT_2029124 [Suillus lakei]